MFAGAVLAARYVPSGAAASCASPDRPGTPQRPRWPGGYACPGRSAVAEVFRAGRPLWPSAAELAARREAVPAGLAPDAALGVLPVGTDDRRLGCLVVVDDTGRGFDADRRGFLSWPPNRSPPASTRAARPGTAHAAASGAGGARPGAGRRAGEAPGRVMAGVPGTERPGSFTLELTPGGPVPTRGCSNSSPSPRRLDGRLETLARTVPDDLPPSCPWSSSWGRVALASGELEFRVRRPSGAPRWLRLRSRVLTPPAGRPERVLGIVVDAGRRCAWTDEVSPVQRLSASLAATTTARDVARAVVGALRDPSSALTASPSRAWRATVLIVTVLDPPESGAWPAVWPPEWCPEWLRPPFVLPPTPAAALPGRWARGLVPAGAELNRLFAGQGPAGLASAAACRGCVIGACLAAGTSRMSSAPRDIPADRHRRAWFGSGAALRVASRLDRLRTNWPLYPPAQPAAAQAPRAVAGVAVARHPTDGQPGGRRRLV
ncbi:hypothetical protein LUX05_24615 [Streptomyces somaliensis]|nr:hypothetical protein [Streptomyces somaliensis]